MNYLNKRKRIIFRNMKRISVSIWVNSGETRREALEGFWVCRKRHLDAFVQKYVKNPDTPLPRGGLVL